MTLNPTENGRALTTADGQLHAAALMPPDPSVQMHPWLEPEPAPAGEGAWTITATPSGILHGPFQVSVWFTPFAPPPFAIETIPYADGAMRQVPLHRLAMPTPPPANFVIHWTDLDGRPLPDGDEIVLRTHPRRLAGSFVELETSAQVNWWKEVHLVNRTRNLDARVVRTDGPNQNRAGPGVAVPAGGTNPPDPVLFRDLRLVLHKPKFLGTDTPIYELDMNAAPYLAGPTTFHFLWRHQ